MIALVAVLGYVLALAAIAYVALGRRKVARRLGSATVQLGGSEASEEDGSGLGAGLDRLERVIEQRMLSERLAVASEARLTAAFEVIPQGVIVTDEARSVVFRNRHADVLASPRHADALVAAAVDEMLAAAVGGIGGTRTLDLFGPPPRTVVVTTAPLPSAAGTGAVAVVDDVSERRRLEAVRRDFVANISHELKTPVGALGLLAETLVAEDDEAVTRRLAGRIQIEAFRVGRTIEDLLELSQIESGELPRREVVSVELVVTEAVERIRPAAEQAGIEVQVHEPSPRLVVTGDRRQLVSALSNLLDNAVKYSDDGSPVEVSARTDGVDVEITVRDHGIGIPARDLERVFERFYRVDQARSRQTGGTGLGLAIVRHVLSNHAGDIRVESRLGEGSSFSLRLPTASGPVPLDGLGEEIA